MTRLEKAKLAIKQGVKVQTPHEDFITGIEGGMGSDYSPLFVVGIDKGKEPFVSYSYKWHHLTFDGFHIDEWEPPTPAPAWTEEQIRNVFESAGVGAFVSLHGGLNGIYPTFDLGEFISHLKELNK